MMERLKVRFTRWYLRRGYRFREASPDGCEKAVWTCPLWVFPLLVFFSPSTYRRLEVSRLLSAGWEGLKKRLERWEGGV